MFEDLGGYDERERMAYRPTGWQSLSGESLTGGPERNAQAPEKKKGDGAASAAGILNGVRGIVKDNEELIILVIVLFILADCGDNTELLIALAVLFLPALLGMFKK